MSDWVDYAAAYGGDHTVSGTVRVLRDLASPQLGNRRDLLVYLPPSYASGDRRYTAVYMHDGQNLFDRATSFAGAWEVDRMLDAASRAGLEAIVVGIPNAGEQRITEYSPFQDGRAGGGRGDAYVSFLRDTVKPIIDAEFRTRTEPRDTGIAGASMGGLISLYALVARPDTFGFAAAFSPSLWFAERAIFGTIEAMSHPVGRVYVDIGTGERAGAVADVKRLRDLLLEKGYRRGHDLFWIIEKGGRHHEQSWGRRLRHALEFLVER
jgi:predicted alpha/beta superfamily hydrolase